MKVMLSSTFVLCCMAVALALPTREIEEVHQRNAAVDILQPQESRWGWGNGGVDVEARAEAAGVASAANFDIDGFGGRRDFEIGAAGEAGVDFAAGGFGGGW
ncbi:unnamed protein product, partial [Iphiclides podalirius]